VLVAQCFLGTILLQFTIANLSKTAAVNGGAVGAWSSTVTIDNSNYIANTADFGGAL